MNLVFKHLKVENFFSIGSADIDFKDQGIVYVKGINKETNPPQSNGSGKSSIFDAILWTLYGETLRGASEVKNSYTFDGTVCELSFSIDMTEYMIRRSKGHSKFGSNILVYENGELLTDSIKKSQDAINNILAISSAQILGSIVLLGQGLPYKFSDLSQIKRKELLEELSGSSEQIAQIQSALTKEKTSYEQAVTKATMELRESTGRVSGYTNSITKFKQLIADQKPSDVIDQEITAAEQKKLEDNTEIASLNEQILKYDDANAVVNKVVTSTNTYLTVQTQERNNLVRERDSLQSVCPVCKRPFDSAEDIENHRKELDGKISELDNSISLLKTKLTDNQAIINENNHNRGELASKVWSLTNEVRALESTINQLQSQKTQTQGLETQIQDLEKNIEEENRKGHQCNEEIETNQNVLDSVSWLLRETSREFKGLLLEDTVKLLSYKAQQYGKYLVDKDITLELSGSKVLISLGDTLYENLSGGERRRVDLSVQFALREMLSITNGFSCNLLVLDEVFDNLDIQGAERLIFLISSEFTDVESMYIITHHTDFDIPYDCTLVVTKDGGVSSLHFE